MMGKAVHGEGIDFMSFRLLTTELDTGEGGGSVLCHRGKNFLYLAGPFSASNILLDLQSSLRGSLKLLVYYTNTILWAHSHTLFSSKEFFPSDKAHS